MDELIKQHYENEDILRLNLCTDLEKWNAEVNFIETENEFYLKLFSSPLIEKTALSPYDIALLKQQLDNIAIKNVHFLDKLREFLIELEGIKECDDIFCETYYLNNHQKFKIEIENFFFENRKFKTLMYSYLTEGVKQSL